MAIPTHLFESLSVYLPMDRRHALARGEDLPMRGQGAALFADISGFTPLTEALAAELGHRRGAEELARHLNRVYDDLILELQRYRGSVVGFSGDAITCWLEGDDGRRATACALSMQHAMEAFTEMRTPGGSPIKLAIRVAVTVGPVRRFLVGDPSYLIVDTIAGTTLDRLATAEHLAEKGQVIIDAAAAASLGDDLEILDWRRAEPEGERFVVVDRLKNTAPPEPWPELPKGALEQDKLLPWLLPPIRSRLLSGQGDFLAELRPAVALFLRFGGIDYDRDDLAAFKLDSFVSQVMEVLARYDGSLIQLTIGDKGSYIYAAFGAPVAHEDDARRAVAAAQDLRVLEERLEITSGLQIGITQGRMRTGAYGSSTRRTYGVLGDAVNLAARLMQAASKGQILVEHTLRLATGDIFDWEVLPELVVKGKSEPVQVAALAGLRSHSRQSLHESAYTLPMVGRQDDLKQLKTMLEQVAEGKGQLVGITAEAGIGKSRLAAEFLRQAGRAGFEVYGSECQSFGTTSSYLVWQEVWRNIFDLRPDGSLDEWIAALERQLGAIDPDLIPRLPLLGSVLNLPIPQNDFTRPFDAKLRKSSLEALLVDCLRSRAKSGPLVIFLEDCHWLDPLSLDLLEVIARAISNLPIMLLLTYRPLEQERERVLRALPQFSEISLTEFTPHEAETLIRLKLDQLFGSQSQVPQALVRRVIDRAAGNPFYVEELLNYFKDQDLDPGDSRALAQIDLPTSLHSLILSRIDQLTESQKTTLKVASVIGRLFRAAMVWGVYPQLGDMRRVKQDLAQLDRLDLTPMDTPEPELTYLFKNVITQQVTYENMPFATRARLHNMIGGYFETNFPEELDQYVDLLAHHFGRSRNEAKKREYYLRAGESAQADYSNSAALTYYQRVLPLLPEAERVEVMLKLVRVLELVGQWHEAGELIQRALELAERLQDRRAQASCQSAMGDLLRKQGLYSEAALWLEKAQTTFYTLNDQSGVGEVLHIAGTLAAQQGDFARSQDLWQQSLAIRKLLDDQSKIASLLSNLAIAAEFQGQYAEARAFNYEALGIRRLLGDKWAIAVSLNNLGHHLTVFQDKAEEALPLLEEAVQLQRQVGDRWYLANAAHNLATAMRAQGDFDQARSLYEESLGINQELGDRRALAYLLEDMGVLAALQSEAERAMVLVEAAGVLREQIGSPLSSVEAEQLEAALQATQETLDPSTNAAARARGKALSLEAAIEFAREKSG